MESDDFTRHYIIRYLSARELVLPPLGVCVCGCVVWGGERGGSYVGMCGCL